LIKPGITSVNIQKKELAHSPPMAWNSWNHFNYNINEYTLKEIADAMATKGLKEAGYEYLVFDDSWQIDRYPNEKIIADSTKFPSCALFFLKSS
jgi:alpha-galactosidase